MTAVDRRSFVKGSLAGLGAAGLSAAGLGAATAPGAAAADAAPSAGEQAQRSGLLDRVPFDGPHQAGILTPAPAAATFVALDAVAPNRAALQRGLEVFSARARQLAQGGQNLGLPQDDPPADSGTLGPVNAPDRVTVTVAFGASLFDDRYGLAALRPAKLTAMPRFTNDNIDPAQRGGDLMVQICANQRDTVVHTLRELLRPVRDTLQVRWTIDGFQSAPRGPKPTSSKRNLFAFRDGTSNPNTGDDALMRRLVWADTSGSEPAWTANGTYQVVRIIRMHAEFWDRVGLREQENMIGRVRDSGAPLGGTDEFQDPRYDLDPKGDRIPLDAHIRLANPRDAKTVDQRILRRPFNYHRGFDAAGALDQGLVFVAFNQDPARQFAAIQRRLDGEPMVDYVTPVGGGYFFAVPGTGSSVGWLGAGLLSA